MNDADRYRYLLTILSEEPVPVRRFYLKPGEYVVGSLPECDVHLPIAGVSRRHATIEILDDGGAVLTDLGSKNGTYLGGRKVKRGAALGSAIVACGPARAELLLLTRSSGHLLIEGDQPPDLTGTARPSNDPLKSPTAGTSLVEQVIYSFNHALKGVEPPTDPAATLAPLIVQDLVLLLDPQRIDLGQGTDGAEVVIATGGDPSFRSDRLPELEVRVPGGWWLKLWKVNPRLLRPIRPTLEVVLRLLSLTSHGGLSFAPGQAPPGGELPLPPPGSLSVEIKGLYRRAAKVAQGAIPILILGESGTGKEVLARWIHERSPRAARTFLTFNCAALPRDLLEAELFGIERGVATGVDRRTGILEQADGGTILLDEIGDMALETQAKLLRVLEGKRFYHVGGRAEITVDVRFLAATNRPLDELVASGAFRRDLYHRLAAFVVSLPPLRARKEDVSLLAAHFFHRECARVGCQSPGITRAALGALVGHPWPGNVRQLENEIAKAVLLLDKGEPLDLPHLSRPIREAGKVNQAALPLTLATAVGDAERQAFRLALAVADGDPARARAILGVSRATYYRKLKELRAE
jgi:hypothetical protein